MRRRVPAVLLCVVLGLSACGGGDDDSAGSSPTGTPSSSATAEDSPSPSPSASSSASTGGAPVAVGKTITDDALGNTVVVKNEVRGFPVPDRLPALKSSDTEIVLVEVEVTAGAKFYGSAGRGDFRIVADGMQNSSTTTIDEELRAAGYEPLEDVKAGETGSGWVAFTLRPSGQQDLVFRYKRLAYTVSGGGSIEAQDFDVPLPA